MANWTITRNIILVIGILLLAATVGLFIVTPLKSDRSVFDLPPVPLLSDQFDSRIAPIATEFEELVTNANARLIDLQNTAKREEFWSSVIGWIALLVSSTIPILAAFAGVNVNQLPTAPQARSKIIVTIAVLGAISSSLLLVNERLDSLSAEAQKLAKQLYEQTGVARRAFLAESNPDAAEQIKVGLFRSLVEAGGALPQH
jgi:hypothetical protein